MSNWGRSETLLGTQDTLMSRSGRKCISWYWDNHIMRIAQLSVMPIEKYSLLHVRLSRATGCDLKRICLQRKSGLQNTSMQ